MKKKYIFSIILFLLFTFIPSSPACFADEQYYEQSELEEKAVQAYEAFSFEKVFESVKASFSEAFFPSMPLFSGLLALVLISAVSNAFDISFGGFDIGAYVNALCFSGFCFSIIKSLTDNLAEYITKLRDICAVIAPTLVAASVSEGAVTVKTGYGGLVASIAVIEFLVSSVAIPCVKLLFILSVVSVISGKTVNICAVSASIRTFAIFFVCLLMTAVVTVMHFQNIIAHAVDSVGLRAVRFASASLVPLVGGLVGESVKTVTEALRAVKGITGAVGVASVISACLPPLAAILVFKLEITVCNCLSKMLGCGSASGILTEANGILNILQAALFASTIGFSAMICIIAHAV